MCFEAYVSGTPPLEFSVSLQSKGCEVVIVVIAGDGKIGLCRLHWSLVMSSIFTQIHVQVLEVNHYTETWDTMDTPTKSDLDKSDVFVVRIFSNVANLSI